MIVWLEGFGESFGGVIRVANHDVEWPDGRSGLGAVCSLSLEAREVLDFIYNSSIILSIDFSYMLNSMFHSPMREHPRSSLTHHDLYTLGTFERPVHCLAWCYSERLNDAILLMQPILSTILGHRLALV